MEATIKKYAPSLLPLFVLVLGVFQAAGDSANLLNPVIITQVVILLAQAGAAYWLPLLPKGWQGAFKTGAGIVAVILVAVLPYVISGHITQAQLILVLTSIVKTIATELGVQIRTDSTIDAGSTSDPGVPSLTSVQTVADTPVSSTVPDTTDTSTAVPAVS
ncbi:hypothetical protein [Curtobacterium sp. MCBD17_028]|uniref:hypothetical protein n=1 Tax=Curtobacterium sp. MCBD17_028 TaxID=2175670 RepID=UPI000DA996D5|nr:hypothetical protein [Curtobacterium sp. MCBD17_028]PZE23849.1 hypothetical protein DEI86_13465 [Curtobacterium sp. MCBD17_028]